MYTESIPQPVAHHGLHARRRHAADRDYLRELGCSNYSEVSVAALEHWLQFKLSSTASLQELAEVEDFAVRCLRGTLR